MQGRFWARISGTTLAMSLASCSSNPSDSPADAAAQDGGAKDALPGVLDATSNDASLADSSLPPADAVGERALDAGADATSPVDATVDAPADSGSADAWTDDGAIADAGAPDGPLVTCEASPCAVGLATGYEHTCALMANHEVRCFGNNVLGALGYGLLDAGIAIPDKNWVPVPAAGVANADQLGVGFYSSCAKLTDGTVKCWGQNSYGQLGLGDASNSEPHAQPISIPYLSNVASVSRGAAYDFCAVSNDGKVICWGDNHAGELGRPLATTSSSVPAEVTFAPGTAPAVEVATGYGHTCARMADATIQCWGTNGMGQLGRVIDSGASDVVPAPVPGVASATSVAASWNSVCASLSSGSVMCWGSNGYGELGVGPSGPATQQSPVFVALPPGIKIRRVYNGYVEFCGLSTDGRVVCWGGNDSGGVGVGTYDDASVFSPIQVPTPVIVPGLPRIVDLAPGGGYQMCALAEDGSVYCWGRNVYGQISRPLPDSGATDSRNYPVPARVIF